MDGSVLERLEKNLARVKDRITAAAERAGRDPSGVTLVAVTKSVDVKTADLLIRAGVRHLGENRVQEGERKHKVIGDLCHWHMIGHLQTNKVQRALKIFRTIHSVDSARLLEAIARRAGEGGFHPDILLEVNVSGEESKYGFRTGEVEEAAAAAAGMSSLALRGLMTMAPWNPDPEAARPVFRELASLFASLRDSGRAGSRFDMLSMGMSQDFEAAVEEGATHVRIGTALFEGL